MDKAVFLEYTFIFDPSKTWTSLYEFEQDLSKMLKANGLEANIVKTAEGQFGRRLLFIKKNEELPKIDKSNSKPNKPSGRFTTGGVKVDNVQNG